MVVSAKKKKELEKDKGQKSLFGSSVSVQPVVTAKKKTEKPYKEKKITTDTEPTQAQDTYKKPKERVSREDIIQGYIESYNWGNIEYNFSYALEFPLFNKCCENLEEALLNKAYNREIVDALKRIISSANLKTMQMFFTYASLNAVLFNYINEVYPNLDPYQMFAAVDRAYAELIYGN